MDVNLSNSYRPRLARPPSVSPCPCPGVRNSMSLAPSQLQQPPNGCIPPLPPPPNSSIMQQEYHFRAPNHSYNIPPSMTMNENIWPSSFIPPRSSTAVYQNNPMMMQCNNTSNNNTPHQPPYSNGWNPRPPGSSILQPIGNYEVPVTHWGNHPINNSGAYYHHPHPQQQQQHPQQQHHHNIITNCSGPPSGRQQQQPLSQGVGVMGNVHSQVLSARSGNNSRNNNPHMHGNSMMTNSHMRSSGISNNRIQNGKNNNHVTVNNNNTNSNVCPPRQPQSNFQASYSHRGGSHNNQGRNNNHHGNNSHGNHSKMSGGGNMNRNGNSRHRFDTPVSSVNSSTSNSSSNSHVENSSKQQALSEKNGQHVNQSQSKPQTQTEPQSEIVQNQKFSLSSTKYGETKPPSTKVQVPKEPQEQKPISEPENYCVTSNPADEFFASPTADCHRLQEELLKPVKAIERTVSQNGRRRRRSSEKSLLFDRRPDSQSQVLSAEKTQNASINTVYSCKKKSAVIENMMKGLVQKRDTEQVIYMAQAYDQSEVYILAANYLETTDWQSPSSTNKNIRELIIDFYSRADAKNALAAFLSKVSASNASIQRNGFGFRGWSFPREYSPPVILHHDEASSNDAYDADESADESELEELVRDTRNDKRINVPSTSISTNISSNVPFLQDLGARRIQNSTTFNYFVNPWRKI